MGVTIVCLDRDGNELARQTVDDEATARRLMIARNRPLPGSIGLSYPAWGIETYVRTLRCDASGNWVPITS